MGCGPRLPPPCSVSPTRSLSGGSSESTPERTTRWVHHLDTLRFTFAPKGIPATALIPDQRQILDALIASYLDRLPEDLADAEQDKLALPDNDLHFAWAGPLEPGRPHYYRMQGIECCSNTTIWTATTFTPCGAIPAATSVTTPSPGTGPPLTVNRRGTFRRYSVVVVTRSDGKDWWSLRKTVACPAGIGGPAMELARMHGALEPMRKIARR